jgi:futalosine hydrolase
MRGFSGEPCKGEGLSPVQATLLVCSVRLEMEPLLASISGADPLDHPRLTGWRGTLADRPVLAVVGGMGKTNAARSLAAALERFSVERVIGFGVGGAYPGSGLRVGDLCLASREFYGDEGVLTPDGWMSCEGIGIPLLETPLARHFNDFPVDQAWLEAGLGVLRDAGAPCSSGPFVTVSSCSGTAERGDELARRFGGICETMEGAAYAHVAALYELPFLEVRGISNLVEDRDLSRWRLHQAARAAAGALSVLVQVR